MRRVLSILQVGVAVAALLPAVAANLMMLWSSLNMLTSVQRFYQILGTLVPFYLPVAAGITVAWLATRWRGPIVGFVAGAFVIELGYVVAAMLSIKYSPPNPDAGLILFLPIYCGPIHILALAGGMYLLGLWPRRKLGS